TPSSSEDYGFKDKTKTVLSRVGLETSSISLKKSQATMRREIFWQLPNDYKTMVEVRNNGVPLSEQARKAGITQSLTALAESLTGEKHNAGDAAVPATGKPPAGRWLSFLSGSKAKK